MIRGLFHRPRHLTGVPVAEIHERLHSELIPVVFGGNDNMRIVRRASDGEQFFQWNGVVHISPDLPESVGTVIFDIPESDVLFGVTS